MPRVIELADYTEDYLRDLNSVLQGPFISPMGAYCMGLVEGLAHSETGTMPCRYLLQLAADCQKPDEAVELVERWMTDIQELRTRRRLQHAPAQ